MRYTVVVTVNYKDGTDREVTVNPKHLEDLKILVATFIKDSRDASSWMFTVVENSRGNRDEKD